MNYRRSIEVENLSHSSAACGVMYMYGWESHSYQKKKFPFRGSKNFISVHFEGPVKE